ncbi:MAG TPA: hypothetical protein VFA78_00220 [Chloroflexota bacterium]|nr:hypothetical protein [Chloroflexota bacterium]
MRMFAAIAVLAGMVVAGVASGGIGWAGVASAAPVSHSRADAPKCAKHGYKNAGCRVARGHHKTVISGGQLPISKHIHAQLIVNNTHNYDEDVVTVAVSNPCTDHPNGSAISIHAYNDSTGQALTTFNPPFTVRHAHVYAYNPGTGSCTAVPMDSNGNPEITGPGIYVLTP